MKGFIDEPPTCINSLGGTSFLTTDLAQILAGGYSIIFCNHFFFFSPRVHEIKILQSAQRTETGHKETGWPSSESVGHFGVYPGVKHKSKAHSFFRQITAGKLPRDKNKHLPSYRTGSWIRRLRRGGGRLGFSLQYFTSSTELFTMEQIDKRDLSSLS